jgi:hypothetical protein
MLLLMMRRSMPRVEGARGRVAVVVAILERVREILNLTVGFVLADAIGLLNLPGENLALTVDGGELIVGQFAPFLLNLPFDLFPVALHTIPVHRRFLRMTAAPAEKCGLILVESKSRANALCAGLGLRLARGRCRSAAYM